MYLWTTKKAPFCSQLHSYHPLPQRLLGLNQVILPSKCRDSSSTPARINVFLGLLQQNAPSKNVFGIRIAVEGCNPNGGQIPIEVAVLRKI
jgi:hypothetical protein